MVRRLTSMKKRKTAPVGQHQQLRQTIEQNKLWSALPNPLTRTSYSLNPLTKSVILSTRAHSPCPCGRAHIKIASAWHLVIENKRVVIEHPSQDASILFDCCIDDGRHVHREGNTTIHSLPTQQPTSPNITIIVGWPAFIVASLILHPNPLPCITYNSLHIWCHRCCSRGSWDLQCHSPHPFVLSHVSPLFNHLHDGRGGWITETGTRKPWSRTPMTIVQLRPPRATPQTRARTTGTKLLSRTSRNSEPVKGTE